MTRENTAPPLAFGWTILHVRDVAQAITFYERAFGLESRFVDPAGEYAELATGTTTLAFAAHSLIARLTGEPIPDAAPRGLDIAFTTSPDHIEAAWTRAVEAGAKPVKPLATMPWGQTVGFLRDPEGFLVEICTPTG
jgi:uncharacterized glyoxalase superfamily protein PhnB